MAAAVVLAGVVVAMLGGLAALAGGFGFAALGAYVVCGVASSLLIAVAAARAEGRN